MTEQITPSGEVMEKRSETLMENTGFEEQDDSPESISEAERAKGERQPAD